MRIARIPTFTTFTETCSLTEVTTARLSPSTSPNPAPNGPDVSESLLASPLIWIAICLVLLLVIGIAYGVIYVRRRAFKRRMSDKEHQSKTGSRSAAYQSSAALIRSSNVLAEHVPEQAAISTLASVESKPPVPQRPALDSSSVRLVRKDSGLSLYKSSSRPDIPPVVAPTDFGLPTYKATTRPSIAPGISSNKLIGSPSAKSLSRIGGSMTDGKPTSNNPSDQSVMGSQRTLVAAESVIKMGTGAHRPGDYPLVVRPTKTSTLSRKGNTTSMRCASGDVYHFC